MQHFGKFLFIDDADAEAFRLIQFTARGLARHDERGFARNGALAHAAAFFDGFLRVAALEIFQRARQNDVFARKYPLRALFDKGRYARRKQSSDLFPVF